MWLSKQTKRTRSLSPARCGEVSIAGENPAVLADAEYRGLNVCSIGSVYWMPKAGQELVILSPDSEERCVVGCIAQTPEGMQPGEVLIRTAGAELHIKNDGAVEIAGDVRITGTLTLNGRSLEGEENGA